MRSITDWLKRLRQRRSRLRVILNGITHYVPPLNARATGGGMAPWELRDMGETAAEALGLFPTFEVMTVRIYQEIDGR